MRALEVFLLTFTITSGITAAAQPNAQAAPATQPSTVTPGALQLAAQRAINAWLALVDSGEYAASWKQSGTAFQSAVTQEKWATTIQGVRAPLGKVIVRRLRSATYTQALPGVPDGEYEVFIFETSFEHKQLGYETVIASQEKDGTWKVVGYYIK